MLTEALVLSVRLREGEGEKVSRTVSWLALVCLVLCFLAPSPSLGEDSKLLAVGVRGGTSGLSLIGAEEIEHFREYDAFAMFRLPWQWYSESGWGIGTRFLVSAGALTAAGETGFLGTAMPVIELGPKSGRFSLGLGGGGGLLSDYTFGNQNLGGTFQFVWNVSLRMAVYRGLGLGYWFQHMSDATIYGEGSRGVDLHMLEISYRF